MSQMHSENTSAPPESKEGRNSKKVLVIDDSNTIRSTSETFLKELNYEVSTAENGIDALIKIQGFKPDIIFTDIMMPEMDGYATIALLRSNPDTRATPIVVLSSKSGVFDVARARLIGCNDYLVKPFSKGKLQEMISLYVDQAA